MGRCSITAMSSTSSAVSAERSAKRPTRQGLHRHLSCRYLSGGPKVRAMQLISQLEPHNRGAYGGCIGFIGLNGSLNQAITIRTLSAATVSSGSRQAAASYAKSNDGYELQEVNNKLGALKKAIEMAENVSLCTI